MAGAPVELTIDQQGLAMVARVLKSEADGKTLRRNLVRELKATAETPIGKARAEMLSTPSRGLGRGASLRSTVAKSIKPVSRLSGQATGVSIRQARTPELRNFKMAGRRFNRGDFRRPVFGTDRYVVQSGNLEWFDRPMQDAKPDFKADVLRVVQELSDTLAARARAAARS
jgi:hypothetical protein